MKLWFISDTHCKHDGLEVPDADAIIHCGDESTHGNAWMNEPEARKFFEWYSALQIPTKFFVPGNHSTAIVPLSVQSSPYLSVKIKLRN